MKDSIEKIRVYVETCGNEIKQLEEENKNLKEALIEKKQEIEELKTNGATNNDEHLREELKELIEERDLIKNKVETIIKHIDSL